MEENINVEVSEIQKFYRGANIFITGGSGFLGHLLIQKLIRDCPDISKLYLLIRSKKGKTPEERIEEMFKDPLFDRMKLEQPKYLEKIKLIVGDMEERDLGLKETDKQLIKDQVNIIFHVAATVRLDGKIKTATFLNLRTTKDLIMIAKTITNLKAFVHVSTAYSHAYRTEVDEQFYDVPITPERLIQIAEMLNDDELDILTPKLIGEWPNTYSFTKALAETVIQQNGKNLPIAIVRPSMVISTYKDPVEGWINNLYGPIGLSVGIALGVIRVLQLGGADVNGDVVPGDYVVNSFIAAAWHAGRTFRNSTKIDAENNKVPDELKTSNEIHIFNYISNSENPLKLGEYIKMASRGLKWQTIHVIWYYFLIITKSNFMTSFLSLFLHIIPAHFVDTILLVLGKKPRLVKIYKKIEDFNKVTLYFRMNEWKFINNNTQALWQNLNATDRTLFPFSMKELSWNDYFEDFGKGLRQYLLKDPLETLPAALAKYKKLKIAHYCLVSFISFIVLTVVYNIFHMFL